METTVTTLGKANKTLSAEKGGNRYQVAQPLWYHSFATKHCAEHAGTVLLFGLSKVTQDAKW